MEVFAKFSTALVITFDRIYSRIAMSNSEGLASNDDDNEGSRQYTESKREAATRTHLPAAAATQRGTLRSKRRRHQGQEQQPRGGGTRVRCDATKMLSLDVYCM